VKDTFDSVVIRSYKDEPAETPFDNAEQIADYLTTIERREKIRYMIAFIVTMLILGVSVAGNVWQGISAKVEPIFVPVDVTGNTMPVGVRVGTQNTYDPPEQLYIHFLSEFIRNVRSKTLDPVVDYTNFQKSRGYVGMVALNKLESIINAEKQNQSDAGALSVRTIQVNIVSVMPVAGGSDKSKVYQARWNEILYNEIGEIIVTRRLTGTFLTERIVPADVQTVIVNPLGLYVTDFSWDRDLS
jgi:type IV secretion system protein VirB5